MPSSSISCPDLHRLQEMLAGSLPEHEQSSLTSHLDTCATCRQTLEDLATDGESWSDMMSRLKNKSATMEPALEQAIEQIKLASGGEVSGEDKDKAPLTAHDSPSLDFLSPPEKPGQIGRLAHYEISEVIGQGGMGIVLKGFDSTLHRVVAIKVLLAPNQAARKRFLREARAAAKITHDHVVTIHAVDEANVPYLVMQYIAGVSLQERLDQGKPLELEPIVRIGYQIACGLATAHAQGLVHRDIKPANILLESGTERVKITDFGLARAIDDVSMTQSGVVAGTPLFMAPEQARGEPLDHRADLFSLGSVLYMMCTGRAPFRGESSMAVLRRVSEDTPKAIQEINPTIPDWLVAVIAKLRIPNSAISRLRRSRRYSKTG
jgi:serine/threonine-protein kinase